MKSSPYTNKTYLMRSQTLRYLTDNKCKICECQHENSECHHIDGNNRNNNWNNLAILCPMHHRLVHLSDFNPDHLRTNIIAALFHKYHAELRNCEVAAHYEIIPKHFELNNKKSYRDHTAKNP